MILEDYKLPNEGSIESLNQLSRFRSDLLDKCKDEQVWELMKEAYKAIEAVTSKNRKDFTVVCRKNGFVVALPFAARHYSAGIRKYKKLFDKYNVTEYVVFKHCVVEQSQFMYSMCYNRMPWNMAPSSNGEDTSPSS